MIVQHIGEYLGSEGREVGEVLVVELIESAHVLAEAYEPVDGGKVFALSQLLVETPEHLHNAERRRCNRVRKVTTRRRHTTINKLILQLHVIIKKLIEHMTLTLRRS